MTDLKVFQRKKPEDMHWWTEVVTNINNHKTATFILVSAWTFFFKDMSRFEIEGCLVVGVGRFFGSRYRPFAYFLFPAQLSVPVLFTA